jgi:hypothetical protein
VLTTGPQRSIFPMNTGRMTKWRIRNSWRGIPLQHVHLMHWMMGWGWGGDDLRSRFLWDRTWSLCNPKHLYSTSGRHVRVGMTETTLVQYVALNAAEWVSHYTQQWNLYLYTNGHPRWSSGNVCAIGSKVRGSNSTKNNRFLRTIKIRSTTFFGGEVRPLAPYEPFYCMLRNPTSMKDILRRTNSTAISSPSFSCFATRCLCR